MGSCMSSSAAEEPRGDGSENKKDQRERSYQIDKQIEEDSKKYRKECKILLLGESRMPFKEVSPAIIVRNPRPALLHRAQRITSPVVIQRRCRYVQRMVVRQVAVLALVLVQGSAWR